MDGFFDEVYRIVAQIPRGYVLSYGRIAAMLGRPHAARMVGWAMRCCPNGLPWQRVVKADGSIADGGFADLRRAKLMDDGIKFRADGRIDMDACMWDGRDDA